MENELVKQRSLQAEGRTEHRITNLSSSKGTSVVGRRGWPGIGPTEEQANGLGLTGYLAFPLERSPA